MKIPDFIDKATLPEISYKLAELAVSGDPESISVIAEFLLYKCGDTYLKHDLPNLAATALLHKGCVGVQKLVEVLPKAPGYIYPQAILATLWYASKGKLGSSLFTVLERIPPLSDPLNDDVVDEAKNAIHEIVLESRINPELFNILIGFLHQYNIVGMMNPSNPVFSISEIFDLFAAGTIKISRQLVEQFNALLDQTLPEEAYQKFLNSNLVFLDPVASEVIPKQKLGTEYITDFVVRRYDNKYILVEIEKPQDPIFTSANDFTASFTHAYGQILDFQQWIDSHGEYARSLMPGISSPRGLLVIGRRDHLNYENCQKLLRHASNSTTIDVKTFDDLSSDALNLCENIYKKI